MSGRGRGRGRGVAEIAAPGSNSPNADLPGPSEGPGTPVGGAPGQENAEIVPEEDLPAQDPPAIEPPNLPNNAPPPANIIPQVFQTPLDLQTINLRLGGARWGIRFRARCSFWLPVRVRPGAGGIMLMVI